MHVSKKAVSLHLCVLLDSVFMKCCDYLSSRRGHDWLRFGLCFKTFARIPNFKVASAFPVKAVFLKTPSGLFALLLTMRIFVFCSRDGGGSSRGRVGFP